MFIRVVWIEKVIVESKITDIGSNPFRVFKLRFVFGLEGENRVTFSNYGNKIPR